MSDMILNETPVRTSRNFNINNTKIDYEKIKKYLNIKTDFKNVKVINENKTILIDENVESVYNTYSISKELPLEYAVEMNNLINLELEGTIG